MNYTPELAHQVTEVAQSHLRRFVRDPEAACASAFLLKGGCFSGLKFSHGSFRAEWTIGESVVRFFRDGNEILAVDIASDCQQRLVA